LAFACQQGGIVLYVAGLMAIAAWNVIAVQKLVRCLRYIPEKPVPIPNDRGREHATPHILPCPEEEEETFRVTPITTSMTEEAAAEANEEERSSPPPHHPPSGTSTLGRVAWYAFGDPGLMALDILFVLLLLGIIIAYVSAVTSFLADTPFSINTSFDAVITGIIMGVFSLVPDLGYLSSASALGLTVLLAAFIVIACYGIFGTQSPSSQQHPEDGLVASSDTTIESFLWSESPDILALWPRSLSGLSHFFGIVVFGYGVVPLTYNFHESMREPDRLVEATSIALSGVATLYVIMGVGLYALFPHLTADVLHELPETGILPILTRLAMTWVVVSK
jgi:amino acid permease